MSDPEVWEDHGFNPSLFAERFLHLILAEDRAQLLKWGHQRHTPAEWGMITAEEWGEAVKELIEIHFDPRFGRTINHEVRARFEREAIQTVTLLLKLLQMNWEHDL